MDTLAVIWEVVKDLLQFVFKRESRLKVSSTTPIRGDSKNKTRLETTSFVSELEVLKEILLPAPQSGSFARAFVCVSRTRLYQRPVHAFDSVLAWLSYGTAVSLVRYEGRFAQVEQASLTGWILKDELTTLESDVYPVFNMAVIYTAYHNTTSQVRKLIDDDFAAADLALPLLSAEYVTYSLLRAGRKIPWPLERPRLPGRWSYILRGVRGVHIGLLPRTGAIIEYFDHEGEGYLAITEAVHPDGTVIISGVGLESEGVFVRKEVEETWCKERAALWITVA